MLKNLVFTSPDFAFRGWSGRVPGSPCSGRVERSPSCWRQPGTRSSRTRCARSRPGSPCTPPPWWRSSARSPRPAAPRPVCPHGAVSPPRRSSLRQASSSRWVWRSEGGHPLPCPWQRQSHLDLSFERYLNLVFNRLRSFFRLGFDHFYRLVSIIFIGWCRSFLSVSFWSIFEFLTWFDF